MGIFLLTFSIFLLISLAMAIGYLVQNKSIAGSCGGLGAIGVEKACDCPNPCERRRSREEKRLARHEKIAEWHDNQIL